jgi:hypothetical protein
MYGHHINNYLPKEDGSTPRRSHRSCPVAHSMSTLMLGFRRACGRQQATLRGSDRAFAREYFPQDDTRKALDILQYY